MKNITAIKAIVSKIDIKHKDTPEGKIQREQFKRRWGVAYDEPIKPLFSRPGKLSN